MQKTVNLDSYTIDQLLELRDAVEARIAATVSSEIAVLKNRLVVLQSITPKKRKGAGQLKKKPVTRAKSKLNGQEVKRSIAPIKFKDIETGATWTGRGRMPLWLKAHIDDGKTRDDFVCR